MAWVTSTVNGNVFEVSDDALVAKLKAQGHKVTDKDPRAVKPRTVKKSD